MRTPTVTRDTPAPAAEEKLTFAQWPTWYDGDTVAELERLRAELRSLTGDRGIHTRLCLEK